jgi:hypothetical protein
MFHVSRMLLVLSLLAVGCSGIEDPLSRREIRELVSARARWNSSPARNAYTYDVRQSCFCPVEVTVWNSLTVIDGVIVDVRTERGEPVPRSLWPQFSTVDRLFARIEVTDDSYLEDIIVRFDTQYGYPVEMNFVYSPQIADAGIAYYARDLRPAVR